MAFRDSAVVVLETTRTHVRAVHGLAELLKTPSVDFAARVGVRNNIESTIVPSIRDNNPSSSTQSSLPFISAPNASVNDYLVGSSLDEALAAGQDVSVSWPFADGDVRDWTQAEAIWKHALFSQLGIRRVQNESPVLLSFASGRSRATYERICQIFFERFNVAGFGILELPMAQIYAIGALTGVVVDIGLEKTDITPIYDGFILKNTRETISIGLRDCQAYLAHILSLNQSVMTALSPAEAPASPQELQVALLDLVKEIYEEGRVKVPSDGETQIVEEDGVTDIAAVVMAGKEKAVIENSMKKKSITKQTAEERARNAEIEKLDLLTIQFRDKSITLGKERHRLCEPLFDPSLLNTLPNRTDPPPSLSLQETVGHAVLQADADQRQYIWHGLFVTGEITKHVKGIGIALQSRLARYIVSNPDFLTDIQPRAIRVLGVPEYYPEYRSTVDGYAGFLGASITAKLIFNDHMAKSFVSKADYSQKGPRSIIESSPALL